MSTRLLMVWANGFPIVALRPVMFSHFFSGKSANKDISEQFAKLEMLYVHIHVTCLTHPIVLLVLIAVRSLKNTSCWRAYKPHTFLSPEFVLSCWRGAHVLRKRFLDSIRVMHARALKLAPLPHQVHWKCSRATPAPACPDTSDKRPRWWRASPCPHERR